MSIIMTVELVDEELDIKVNQLEASDDEKLVVKNMLELYLAYTQVEAGNIEVTATSGGE